MGKAVRIMDRNSFLFFNGGNLAVTDRSTKLTSLPKHQQK
jgi:hypothetical protein